MIAYSLVRYSAYLVVIIKVDPTAQPVNGLPPLLSVSHHHCSALCIVLFDPEALDSISAGDSKLLVNFKLDREAMSVPAEPSNDMVAFH